jgi:hypothetical protein
MPKVKDLLRKSLLKNVPEKMPDLDTLRRTERNSVFEELRLNRMVFGAFRYGLLGAEGKPTWDRVSSMIHRLQTYSKDHNAEHLVDVANLCQLEFTEGTHRGVVPTDDGPHEIGRAHV